MRTQALRPAVLTFLIAVVLFAGQPGVSRGQTLLFANGPGPTDLYRVELGMNTASFVRTFSFAQVVHAIGLCPDRESGYVMYAIGRDNGNVAVVDYRAATETVVGALPEEFAARVVQLTCDRDGTLFLTDPMNEALYRLDPATCPACRPELVGVVETAPGAGDVDVEGADLQMDPEGFLYLLTNAQGRSLYRVDKETAAAVWVGFVETDFNNGMAMDAKGRLVVSSNDDFLYEIDPQTAAADRLGRLWDGQNLVGISWGDLAGPTPFHCELAVDLQRFEVRAGESVGWSAFLRHHRRKAVEGSLLYWITDAQGTPVTRLRQTGTRRMEYLDEVRHVARFVVPRDAATGRYTFHVAVRSMVQGVATATIDFEVVD